MRERKRNGAKKKKTPQCSLSGVNDCGEPKCKRYGHT